MWISIFGLILSELSFILRVYALWGASRLVAVFLFLLVVGLTCGLVFTSPRSRAINIIINNGEASFSCIATSADGNDVVLVALAGSLIILFVDMVTMCMAIWAIRRKYHVRDRSNRLLRKIRRDTITYFCNNCLIACISVGICLTNVNRAVVPLRIASVLSSIIASTMILDLKDCGNRTFSFTQDLAAAYSMSELSTLHFVTCESQMD
ncbi:hypothetical protein P691DRAFT_802956, partial [Macrolepiota fuliginosa MF-IS2]